MEELSSQPLVSLLVPLYNQEKYFGACMRSINKQTYKKLEIIIVNDGSTDRSPKMAHDWATRDPRVTVIDKQNEGLAYARKDGLLAATGDYVTFLDSDDTLTPCSIEMMLKCAIDTGADLVQGSFDKIMGFLKRRKVDKIFNFPTNQVISQPELFEKYYVGFFSNKVFPVMVWGKLYRKSVLDRAYQETELYSPRIPFMGEDQYFNVKLFPYLNSMCRIDTTVYNYRYGGGTFGFNKNFPQLFLLSEIRLELLDKYNYIQGYKPLFDEYIVCLYYHAAQMIYYNKSKKDDVIDFFKHEIQNRGLVSRLVNYYSKEENQSESVRLFMSKDYDAMYNHANEEANQIFGSLKSRMMRVLIKQLSRFS